MSDKQDDQAYDGSYDFAPKEPESKRPVTRAPQPKKPSEPPAEKPPQARPQPPRPTAKPPEQMLPERTCPHCGFRIVGKAPKGRCPDCAALLDEVTTGRLQFASPTWVTSLSAGTLLVALAVLGHGTAIAMGMLNQSSTGMLIHVIAAAVGTTAVWIATRPEPGIGAPRSPLALPARLSALAAFLLWILPLAKGSPTEGPDRIIALILAAMALEAILAGFYLRWLAHRIPNDSLVWQFMNLGFITSAVLLALAVLQFIGQARFDPLHPKENYFCGFSTVSALGIVLLWTAITLLRMSTELKSCVEAGRNIEARKQLHAQQAQQKKRS